jgi:hypothetical protein
MSRSGVAVTNGGTVSVFTKAEIEYLGGQGGTSGRDFRLNARSVG